MLVIATGHMVGSVKSSRIDGHVTDWVSACSLIMKDHKVDLKWISEIYLVSNDFMIKTMHAPEYDADPFYLVEDVTDFAEMEI